MGKPKIAIIGAGRVGTTFGRLLREAGYPIGAVVTRHLARTRRARRFIGAGTPMGELSATILEAQILLIATPDSVIPVIARQLAGLGGKNLKGKIALHTSGALDAYALRPLARKQVHVGSIHPLQTFARPQGALDGIAFAIEGDAAAREQASQLARAMGGYSFAISSRHKAAYHAAAALSCGHVLALVDAATRIFVRAGLSEGQARRALLRLVRQTLDNFERLGGRQAWTGPLERRDLATLQLHRRALRSEPAELREAYRALGRLALRLYRLRDRSLARAFHRLFG